jgi:hypothetical protein
LKHSDEKHPLKETLAMKPFAILIGAFCMIGSASHAQETMATSETISVQSAITTPTQEIGVSSKTTPLFKAPTLPAPGDAKTTSPSAQTPKITPKKHVRKAAKPNEASQGVTTDPGPPVSSAYPPATHNGFVMEKRESPYSTTYTAFPAHAVEQQPEQPQINVHVDAPSDKK